MYTYMPALSQQELRMHSFGMAWVRISDPSSLRSLCIKGADESTLITDLSVSLMHLDPCDLGSLTLTQAIPKECTLKLTFFTS